ncbi:MAG: lipocalin-like domain-containing protein [Desmonostoc geniculatum HA4340-LM1]|jgi:hypothetical protein|nr:lipocalin-like domain-containing protein [Desmonostoc geniculatum HA4340-LM1]
MTKEKFIGTWRLIGTRLEDSEGNKTEFLGPNATGLIIYTEQGYMSAHCTVPNPPDKATYCEPFLGKLTPEELAAIPIPSIKSFSYGGKYEIESDTAIHHAEFSSEPYLTGTLPRLFEFTGNQLTLSQFFPHIPNKQVKMYLVWERV